MFPCLSILENKWLTDLLINILGYHIRWTTITWNCTETTQMNDNITMIINFERFPPHSLPDHNDGQVQGILCQSTCPVLSCCHLTPPRIAGPFLPFIHFYSSAHHQKYLLKEYFRVYCLPSLHIFNTMSATYLLVDVLSTSPLLPSTCLIRQTQRTNDQW